jgi:hypothetical protein
MCQKICHRIGQCPGAAPSERSCCFHGDRGVDSPHRQPLRGWLRIPSVSHGRSDLIRPVLISNLEILDDSTTVSLVAGNQ